MRKSWLHTSDPEWGELFTGYRESAYRLECQQQYCSPEQDAAVAQFLSGRPVEIELGWSNSRTRQQAALGRRKEKVRIVVEPQTQYTQVELTVYPRMAEAGEDIRILTVQMGDWPEGLPRHDYWLFDDRDVWRMHYHENYYFKGAELIDDPDLVAGYREARDLAWARAVPLNEYITSGADHEERSNA